MSCFGAMVRLSYPPCNFIRKCRDGTLSLESSGMDDDSIFPNSIVPLFIVCGSFDFQM